VTNPDYDKTFPTLFLPIVVPEKSSEDENNAVMDCFRAFLDVASSESTNNLFLFPNGENLLAGEEHHSTVVVNRTLESMRSMSEAFCDLHGIRNPEDSGSHFPTRFVHSTLMSACSGNDFSPSLIHSSLKGLRPGGYRGMWLAAQNGFLLLHRADSKDGMEDTVCVYILEAQAPNKEVMERVESIRQACPRSATCVPWARFLQPFLSECLWDLATKTPEDAKPKSRKSGEEFEETRDVVKPMYADVPYH
jgi:hypothetical protein